LAKFNIDTEQGSSFKGLPTPANALFWLSIPLIITYGGTESFLESAILSFSKSPKLIAIASLILGVLMVSNIPLLALKFKSFSWSENKWIYMLVISGLVLLALFQLAAIPIILLLYLIFSSIHFYQS